MALLYTIGEVEEFLDYHDRNIQEFIRFKKCLDYTLMGVFFVSVNFAVVNYFTDFLQFKKYSYIIINIV